MGAGSPFESTYAYGNNNPMIFTDPSGKRAAPALALNPILFSSKGGGAPPTTVITRKDGRKVTCRQVEVRDISGRKTLQPTGCKPVKVPPSTTVPPVGTRTLLSTSFDAKSWGVNLWLKLTSNRLAISAFQVNQAPDDGEGTEQVSELLFVKTGLRLLLRSFTADIQRLSPADIGSSPVEVRWFYTYEYRGGRNDYSARTCRIGGEANASCF